MPDFESTIRESGAAYVTSVGIDFMGTWRGKRLPVADMVRANAAMASPSRMSSGRTPWRRT